MFTKNETAGYDFENSLDYEDNRESIVKIVEVFVSYCPVILVHVVSASHADAVRKDKDDDKGIKDAVFRNEGYHFAHSELVRAAEK